MNAKLFAAAALAALPPGLCRALPVRTPRLAAARGQARAVSAPAPLAALAASRVPAGLRATGPAPVPDKAALVERLSGQLASSDAAARRKLSSWIGEIAREHPAADVQLAAARGLARDAAAARNLDYFQHAAGVLESFAGTTAHDAVFEEAVSLLVEAARGSGRAQRWEALGSAARIGLAGSPERRARAAELIEGLGSDPSFRLDRDELKRLADRVRA